MPTLVQRLADSQDAVVRRRAMETVRDYLHDDIEEVAMMKLWRALFFAMWLCDLAPVQREFAEGVASLIDAFSIDGACRWIDAFSKTIFGEWDKLDKHRLDKYYVLVRLVVRRCISFTEWRVDRVEAIAASLEKGILTKLPNGPRLHLCDVMVDEIMEVGAPDEEIPLAALLDPFHKILSSSKDDVLIRRVLSEVCGRLAEHLEGSRSWLQARLYEIAADPATPDKNRAALYASIKKLVALTNQSLDEPKVSSSSSDVLSSSPKKKKDSKVNGTRRKRALVHKLQQKKRRV